MNYDSKHKIYLILEKWISPGSKYHVKSKPKPIHYEVANEGRQNQIFIAGDSHA